MTDQGAGEPRAPRKRGRKHGRPDPARGPVAEFACALWRLKQEAGDPSFDRMRRELGAAASKSALADAARGERLPSWETTWEFVRALAVHVQGRDEAVIRSDWRARWDRAREACERAAATPEPVQPAGPAGPRRGRLVVAGVGAAIAVAATAGVLVAVGTLPDAEPSDALSDAALLVDEAPPDGSTVRVGEHFVKSWTLVNTGSRPWHARTLRRVDTEESVGTCRAPRGVTVPSTPPGRQAVLAARVVAGDDPGWCRVHYKMMLPDGRPAFPDRRPLYLLVRVR